MADRDEDLGLGLRLPWGQVSPPPDEAFAPPPADPPPDLTPGPADDPIAPPPGFEALLEAIDRRFDRLDQRLAGLEHGPDAAVLERLERGFDRGIRLLEGRLELLEDRVASANAATVEALRQVASGGMAEESGGDDVGAVLDRRLDRLETLVASFHEASMGTLGENHERLVAALDAQHATLIHRLAQLAPADLVARLIQGVVTTGEMLDAELIDLKRVLADQRPSTP